MPAHRSAWLGPARAPLLLGCLFALLSCYDHRFTQAFMEQRRAAKAAEGAKIHAAAPPPHAGSGLKAARIRLYVSDEYRRQHGDWQKTWLDVIHTASSVLEPWFKVQLEVVATSSWSPSCPDRQLRACLDELTALDPGEDGDWVVGVLGSLPLFTATFDQLGMASVPGRHMVLRDVSDLTERDNLDRAFDTTLPARRDEIYKQHKAHKRLAIFLHEWGHTLGALHVQQNDSLLYPSYDARTDAYDFANHRLIEAGLHDRFRYEGKHTELIAALRAAAEGDWAHGERQALLARLEPAASARSPVASGSSAAPHHHPFVVEGDEEVLLAQLEPQARLEYREAVRLTASEDAAGAWRLIVPLSERYPTCVAVQHLGCGLAMQRSDHANAQVMCPRASAQAPKKP